MVQTRLTIQNIGKILNSERDFKWISYRELEDRYYFVIESTHTLTEYGFELYRLNEPFYNDNLKCYVNGYRLQLTNSKYRNDTFNTKFVSLEMIKSISSLKQYMTGIIIDVDSSELWAAIN